MRKDDDEDERNGMWRKLKILNIYLISLAITGKRRSRNNVVFSEVGRRLKLMESNRNRIIFYARRCHEGWNFIIHLYWGRNLKTFGSALEVSYYMLLPLIANKWTREWKALEKSYNVMCQQIWSEREFREGNFQQIRKSRISRPTQGSGSSYFSKEMFSKCHAIEWIEFFEGFDKLCSLIQIFNVKTLRNKTWFLSTFFLGLH